MLGKRIKKDYFKSLKTCTPSVLSLKKGIALVLVVTVLSAGTTAFAKAVTKQISVIYNGIKIYNDAKLVEFKDAKGNRIEPFIYNGDVYLPAKSVAQAFGKTYKWDTGKSVVNFGATQVTWLDQLGYVNYETAHNDNRMISWHKDRTSTDGKKYDRGLEFTLGYDKADKEGKVWQSVEYMLDKKYKKLAGKLIPGSDYNNQQAVIIKIFGDESELYVSPPITEGTQAVDIDLDISTRSILKIYMSVPNLQQGWRGSSVGFVDARLLK